MRCVYIISLVGNDGIHIPRTPIHLPWAGRTIDCTRLSGGRVYRANSCAELLGRCTVTYQLGLLPIASRDYGICQASEAAFPLERFYVWWFIFAYSLALFVCAVCRYSSYPSHSFTQSFFYGSPLFFLVLLWWPIGFHIFAMVFYSFGMMFHSFSVFYGTL